MKLPFFGRLAQWRGLSSWRVVSDCATLSTKLRSWTTCCPPCLKICTATAIPFIYSFSGNSTASAPISTFMFPWAIYIFPGSVYIFPPAEQADPLWEYTIIRSKTHECGNWDWGPDNPFLGIFVSNFRHLVFAVYEYGCMLQKMEQTDGRRAIQAAGGHAWSFVLPDWSSLSPVPLPLPSEATPGPLRTQLWEVEPGNPRALSDRAGSIGSVFF